MIKLPQILGLLCFVVVLQGCSARETDAVADSADNNNANTGNNAGSSTGNNTNNSSVGSSGPQNDDTTTTPILSNDNYADIVGYALSFFANEQFPEQVVSGPFPQDFSNPLTSVIDSGTGLETASFVCSNGGTATRTDRELDIDLYDFTNCQISDGVLTGQMGFTFGKYGAAREFIGLTAEYGGGASVHQATGYLADYLGSPCSHNEHTRLVQSYRITQGDQIFEIKDWDSYLEREKFVNSEYCGESDYVVIAGKFTVRSSVTGNNELRVEATETITGRADNPTAGVVTITAADGSSFTIDFDTGDDGTVAVSIANNQGTNTFSEPLTSWIDNLLP